MLNLMKYIKCSVESQEKNRDVDGFCGKMFQDLGGNMYGGVVSSNLEKFLRIV